MNWKALLFVALVSYGAFQHVQKRAVVYGPGVAVKDSPQQQDAKSGITVLNGFTLTPLADFSIEAKVLSRADYFSGRESELSPIDLALGWGPMSDESVLKDISINQSNRFYFWRTETMPIPRAEIESHSANMHLIPANEQVARALEKVRIGEVVSIDGYLVEASTADGWRWRSSLSRTDTGRGACELVLVKSFSKR